MAHGRNVTEGSDEREKNEAAKLLQQFSGTPRFGKRRLHLRASLTERPAHWQMLCKIGTTDAPFSVSEYSTRGGISSYDLRSTMPLAMSPCVSDPAILQTG